MVRFSAAVSGEERCVTTLTTAVKQTRTATTQSTIHPDGRRNASKRRGSSKWLSQEKMIEPTFFLETTTERWNLNQFRVLPVNSSLQSLQKWRFK